jgi:hypothetical protein
MSKRCYLRGTSALGIFNTVIGCLFNRVLVRKVCTICEQRCTVGWYWDKASLHPQEQRDDTRKIV